MWKDKRVLVTGSSGVIGTPLVKLLKEAGANVQTVDKKSDTFPVGSVLADLAIEIPRIIYDFKPQVVFHLAAVFERTVEMAGYWETSFENNVLVSHMLLQTLVDAKSVETFVFASSYLIYDSRQYLDVPQICYLRETDAIRPRNLVGAAKFLFEQELDFIDNVERKFRTISARIYRVYGRGSRDIISRWIRTILAEETILVFGRGNKFDFIFADDVAQGLVRLAESQARGIVNLGLGQPHDIQQVWDTLELLLPNVRAQPLLDLKTPRETSAADMYLFEHYTGWEPQTTLEDGIKNIIEYERERLA